jgi:pyruvate/2-oxoglutarate dehydrogenase complex dihydrolipoamide acyltransferase (E2) component
MDTFNIDVPVPSMGATVSELSVIVIKVQTGDVVTKGQRLADLESDKSAFEFESPCEGTIGEIMGKPGATMMSGDPFLQIETSDESMRHLDSNSAGGGSAAAAASDVIWTPKAKKVAEEAGLDPESITDITATGPGNRVSGDDVKQYLENRG